MTVVPMIWLGYSGMPRRVLDYPASLVDDTLLFQLDIYWVLLV
jgi:heme/copper-type cytochrome/quinol oxidase subunit 1